LVPAADELDEEAGSAVVPETIGLAVVAAGVVMSVSSNPDVYAAARTQHAAI
jgi:hypothetical protein